jgi:rhodanese-related sulfurtransferase
MSTEVNGYAGDLRPREVFERLTNGPGVLIDVRTQAEWTFVGVPDISTLNRQPAFIQWQNYPQGEVDKDFVTKVIHIVGDKKDIPVYFLCRSGQRSQAAATALAQAGYTAAFNILNGFEGAVNDAGHRGKAAGWKAIGLAWKQS